MKDKIEEIKKEFDIKINHCFGDKPSGFKMNCYECDSSVNKDDLWEWVETKIQQEKEKSYLLGVKDGVETIQEGYDEVREEAVKGFIEWLPTFVKISSDVQPVVANSLLRAEARKLAETYLQKGQDEKSKNNNKRK